MKPLITWIALAALAVPHLPVHAQVRVAVEHLGSGEAGPGWPFKTVPRPARTDAAAGAVFTVVDGRRDRNGGDARVLHDGLVPADEDAPADNFFFDAGTDGGRLRVDLGRAVAVREVATYSWHPGSRGPQVYRLYGSDGRAAAFNAQPRRGTDPVVCGWTEVAKVDTRPKSGDGGGMHGVCIRNPAGMLGMYRHLLLDIVPTSNANPFGNTFFSEIDVTDRDAPEPERVDASPGRGEGGVRETIELEGGAYAVTLDTTGAPELTDWAHDAVVPMVREWYPKMVRRLHSDGFEAPARFSIVFDRRMRGVAATSGTRIRCAAGWMHQNLRGEALGAVFHEMVHVVQQYGRAPRVPGAIRPPTWLTEGLTDYLRWYVFEPQTRGAEISRRNLGRARYDGSYRITANFIHWVTQKHGEELVTKLNAILREGRYREDTWKELTGRAVQELDRDWRADLERRLGGEGH
ncbi:MAG: hypothetical protein JXQ71_15320 [Verrucomicrobia bacterium]|nr:hypothetical protein [Verrucomicrobiota bacterium]